MDSSGRIWSLAEVDAMNEAMRERLALVPIPTRDLEAMKAATVAERQRWHALRSTMLARRRDLGERKAAEKKRARKAAARLAAVAVA